MKVMAPLVVPHATHMTVSLGVKTIVPQLQDDAMEFLKEIDQYLYLAKQKGRNRDLAISKLICGWFLSFKSI